MVIVGLIAPVGPSVADECESIITLLPKLIKERTAGGIIETLRTTGESRFLLFAETFHPDVPPKDDMLYAPWVLLARGSSRDASVYCEIGRGNRVEVLGDIHDSKPDKKFGVPGSGFPRCSADILEALQVRMWANKELGDSNTIYFAGQPSGESSFTLLVSKNGDYWTLLEDEHGDPSHACYRARGEDALTDSLKAP